jgi:DNA-directed RNA polymerase subunit M/transcription elongation factor TFIIS
MASGFRKQRLEMGEEEWSEYQKYRKVKNAENYKKRHVEYVVNWRRRTKIKLIEYKGGKCEECGYDKIQFPTAFHFHHRDPNEKDFAISAKTAKFEILKKEVDKCILICSRCHAELHDKEYEKIRQETIERIKKENEKQENKERTIYGYLREKKEKIKLQCPLCGNEFAPRDKGQKFCSQKCSRISSRRVRIRPTKEELIEMLKTMSYCAIGRKYGVSDVSIKKWAKSYDIV